MGDVREGAQRVVIAVLIDDTPLFGGGVDGVLDAEPDVVRVRSVG